jgi:hypothetical protein
MALDAHDPQECGKGPFLKQMRPRSPTSGRSPASAMSEAYDEPGGIRWRAPMF